RPLDDIRCIVVLACKRREANSGHPEHIWIALTPLDSLPRQMYTFLNLRIRDGAPASSQGDIAFADQCGSRRIGRINSECSFEQVDGLAGALFGVFVESPK